MGAKTRLEKKFSRVRIVRCGPADFCGPFSFLATVFDDPRHFCPCGQVECASPRHLHGKSAARQRHRIEQGIGRGEIRNDGARLRAGGQSPVLSFGPNCHDCGRIGSSRPGKRNAARSAIACDGEARTLLRLTEQRGRTSFSQAIGPVALGLRSIDPVVEAGRRRRGGGRR